MIYLLFSILSSAIILVTFKLTERFRVNTFGVITVNYILACLAGFFLAGGELSLFNNLTLSQFLIIGALGTILVVTFRLIALSTLRAGIGITSVASKMSVVIPILFSIWIDHSDRLTPLRAVGILLALIAVMLTVMKKGNSLKPGSALILPIAIFFGLGLIDSTIKYAQQTFVTDSLNPLFNATVFFMALIAALLMLPFNPKAKRGLRKFKTWLMGIVLGVANFGSFYFMIAALNQVNPATGRAIPGSILFGINNIGVVLAGVFLGVLFFNERPNRTNWIGITLSIASIVILMISR